MPSQPNNVAETIANWDALSNHPREPWGAHIGDAEIYVHCSLIRLNGKAFSNKARKQWASAYSEAKNKFNVLAAADVIGHCWNEDAEDRIIDALAGISGDPIIAFPHPSFDDDHGDGWNAPQKGATNAIPYQMATYLARRIGGEVATNIVQASRVGRTKLSRDCRFLWQPSFVGEIESGRSYIIVDDVVTIGGTLAALRSHIVRGGGTVVACSALAHGQAINQKFSIAAHTLSMLQMAYGPGIGAFWRETIGHDIACITEAEARILLEWREGPRSGPGDEALFSLRDRLLAAAAKGGG